MKLSKEENEKSDNVLQKIKYSINRNILHPTRLYSSFKQRPTTSTKLQKQWKINRISNNDKSFLIFLILGILSKHQNIFKINYT